MSYKVDKLVFYLYNKRSNENRVSFYTFVNILYDLSFNFP